MPRKKSAAKKAREAARAAQPKEEEEEAKSVEQESSSSEEEDDYGELVTEEVEEGINHVLQAIRNNETDKLLDSNVRFFEDPAKAVENLGIKEKQRPIYLKDYHRMNILAGETFKDDDDGEATVDGQQSFVSEQKEIKDQLLKEINSAFDDEAASAENDFLVAKKETRHAGKRVLPDPNKDEEKFLDAFVQSQAWIPQEGDKVVPLDRDEAQQIEEDDDEFEEAAEKFENAYNFRYEDPNSAEIISYARNQATLRRSQTTSRRRKREEEKQVKEVEKKAKEQAIQKKKTEKVHKISDVLEQLKKEYGAEINEQMVAKITHTLLNSDFKDSEWDQVIGELFNEEFYDQEAKPTWDEDDEIMADFHEEQDKESEEEEDEEPQRKKSRKEKVIEKKSKKHSKTKLTEMVEKSVEENKLSIIDEVEREQEERKPRSATRDTLKFRYREVSPESFGLSAREIFAADDSQLNQFIGLKKFAPYRPKELRMKDKRKVTKSRRLREWRKEVFHSEAGLVEGVPILEEDNSKTKHHKHHKKNRDKKSRN